MSRDLDTIARRAAENLRAAVETAPLHHGSAPTPAAVRRRPTLRLALIAACLVLGSAMAVALVAEPDPEPAPVTTPPTTVAAPAVSSTIPAPVPGPTEPAVVTTLSPATTIPADTTPPLLQISSPRDGAEVHKSKVTIEGITEPGAVLVTGEREVEVDEGGSWSITLGLAKGANHIEFSARDAAGNVASAQITIRYVMVEPTTTTTTTIVEEHAEFVANASFGVCTLTPPYDVYYGKGEPGSTVYVQSEYGSGTVEVNGEGQWEIQVFFPEAPAGQAFVVNVSDDLGREKAFEFKYQPEGGG
jgi:hypothetical protein